jgi:hypothetical protein
MNDYTRTDFSRFTHRQLHAMLYAGDPRTLRTAADSWDAIGARMHEQAGSLEKRLVDFKHKWQGGAANQYHVMITDLFGGLRRLGDIAFTMRNLANDSADALAKAQATMPQPHDVPQLAPGVVQLATTPLQIDPAAPAEMIYRMQRQQAEATAAVRAHQQASNAAHAQAINVMNELAERYEAANSAMPADTRRMTSQNQRNPLFGTMFTAGLGTATAAAAGRFGGVLPRVPIWAQPNKDAPAPGTEELPAIDPVEPAGLGGGGLGDLGGAGGGIGGGIGGGGFGGGAPTPLPTAHSGMVAGAVGAAGVAAGALGAAAAGTAASAGAGMVPMMPMMPMHPAGGMDSANARRVPPWLVETEDVWGESSAITPSVIGEEQS